jgi:hypothetical protein
MQICDNLIHGMTIEFQYCLPISDYRPVANDCFYSVTFSHWRVLLQVSLHGGLHSEDYIHHSECNVHAVDL